MKLKEKEQLIEYLDKLVVENKEIKLCWEGGGDSGWVWFEIDGDKVSERGGDKKIETLVDYMYDYLDYGSWAGEFSANGEAFYDSKSKSFEGVDYYSEDETLNRACDIQIRIPITLWFDMLEIEIEGEEPSINAAFHIKNGFFTDEHHNYIDKLVKQFDGEMTSVIDDFNNDNDGYEYRSIWEHYELNYADFHKDGDDMVYEIETIGIGTYTTDEKQVYLDLNEIIITDDE